MSFSDHKITQFTHKITDLPDQPSLPANELKARFDSSPEELRQAVNGICDEASRLEARVEGIVVDTFGDTIDREMLSEELAAELDAKAEQTALTGVDSRLQSAEATLQAHTAQLAQKAEVYFGTYTGDGAASRLINIGFTPKAVMVMCGGYATYSKGSQTHWYGGLALAGKPVKASDGRSVLNIEAGGFRVYTESTQVFADYVMSNTAERSYHYIAVK
ncbi:hypothetical protein [Agathobaculum massiliense]|uniref:hypothetical protein n=1 Tax=Agathobaculum massiliense TaxID=3014267 RepID=UPI000D1DC6CC|nr:hypothetical protein [Agathobaculum massiliense]